MQWTMGMAFAGALGLAGCMAVTPAAPDVATEPDLIVRSVSVIDTEAGTFSKPQDILVANGIIISVVSAGAAITPADALEIDGAGLFAMPGLIDVHAHVGEGGIGSQDDSTRLRALQQFMRYGVTSIFVPGGTGSGDADFSRMRTHCETLVGQCPGLFGSGSLITAAGSHPLSTIFGMDSDAPPEVIAALGVSVLAEDTDIEELIAYKAAGGLDAVKIVIEDGPPPWYPRPRLTDEQIAEIVSAAHSQGLKVFAHISTAAQVDLAAKFGADGIMHAPTDFLPADTAAAMAEAGMWYVPTFSLYDGILTWSRAQGENDPYALKGVEPSVIASLANEGFLAAAHEPEAMALAYIENAKANLRTANEAGVEIAMGSDVNNPFVYPGYSAHEELAWMVEAGLTPAEALRAATRGSAAMLGKADTLGRIAPGYEADILLLKRNPLEDVLASRSLASVISDGQAVSPVVSDD